MNRVIEAMGNNNMQQRRYAAGRKAQQWTFNCKTKMIMNFNWKNYCVEIQSNGNNKNIRMISSCSSRWW
jgi:hypothetical protein